MNQKHMNAMDVDKVAAPLRALLEEERDALMDDVEYLRECLEEEANVATRMDAPPPDVGELRAYGAKLREVWEGEKERVPRSTSRWWSERTSRTSTTSARGRAGASGSSARSPPPSSRMMTRATERAA